MQISSSFLVGFVHCQKVWMMVGSLFHHKCLNWWQWPQLILIWTQILQSGPRSLSALEKLSTSQQLTSLSPLRDPSPSNQPISRRASGTGAVVLTPEEVLLTWCHCAEEAVRCHGCLWFQQAPLLFLCGFCDPRHVLNQEHAACHEGGIFFWKSHPQDKLLCINYLNDHK